MTHTTALTGTDASSVLSPTEAGDSANVFTRSDTLLGVCEALGQDFGFNPLWLRLAFIPAIFLVPVQAIVGYLVLGVIVLASRLLFPAAHKGTGMTGDAATHAADRADGGDTAPAHRAEPEPALLAA